MQKVVSCHVMPHIGKLSTPSIGRYVYMYIDGSKLLYIWQPTEGVSVPVHDS